MHLSKSIVALSIAAMLILPASLYSQADQGNFQWVERYLPKPYVEFDHADWTSNATIYEVNLRQYTEEGTFKAFARHLPRLKAMGIDIIWLMPVHPIGEQNRKGTLGSYYAVKDYYGINPEFGTLDDFKWLVNTIHEMGMHVIIDWVANHSAIDNPLASQHPEWYVKNDEGYFISTPWRDYTDIIDFDYAQPGLRKYMTDAMRYWVRETDIDGFRCDIASFVPLDFWENVRSELDQIKPVFMLAESESKDLHRKAFDATYAWSLYDNIFKLASQNINIKGLTEGYIAEHISTHPRSGYRMTFTDNHDKNSWQGPAPTMFGKALPAAIVLSATIDGIPMVYSGQESGLNRSLQFFDKDPIAWADHENERIYTRLFALKHKNRALWNGTWGGSMQRIVNDRMDHVLTFSRQKNSDRVVVIINLSNEFQSATLESSSVSGTYYDLFREREVILGGNDIFDLDPWEYFVLVGTN